MYGVAIFGGKRLETIPVKFSELEKGFLQKIGEKEDRPLGYVVRELMLVGLKNYLVNGWQRSDLDELEALVEKSRGQKGRLTAPDSPNKIKHVPGEGKSKSKVG